MMLLIQISQNQKFSLIVVVVVVLLNFTETLWAVLEVNVLSAYWQQGQQASKDRPAFEMRLEGFFNPEFPSPPETNSSPLKIDPWKRRFLLETIIFRG